MLGGSGGVHVESVSVAPKPVSVLAGCRRPSPSGSYARTPPVRFRGKQHVASTACFALCLSPSLSLSLSLSPFLSLCLCPPPQALQFSRDMLGGCLPSCEHCRQPALTCRPAAKICWKARLWPQTGNPVYRRHDTQEGAVQHGDVTRVIRHHAP